MRLKNIRPFKSNILVSFNDYTSLSKFKSLTGLTVTFSILKNERWITKENKRQVSGHSLQIRLPQFSSKQHMLVCLIIHSMLLYFLQEEHVAWIRFLARAVVLRARNDCLSISTFRSLAFPEPDNFNVLYLSWRIYSCGSRKLGCSRKWHPGPRNPH